MDNVDNDVLVWNMEINKIGWKPSHTWLLLKREILET